MNRHLQPKEDQRRALEDLLGQLFDDLRGLEGERARELAHALHQLTLGIYGRGRWEFQAGRTRLLHFQARQGQGFNYVEAFDAIFPPSA